MDLKKLFKERSDKSGPESDGKLRKTAHLEQILKEIQVRYRKLLNHTQAIQYAHDLQGQFLSVDEEITEFLGYDRNSLLNMNIRLILSPEVRHRFETYLSEIKRQGVSKGLMFVRTISGEKRVLKYFNTLRTEGVTIPFVQGIAYDVTEQKQTRKTLKQLSEQLSVILESLPIVCYICKAEEDYGATYITHNVKAITGFEQTDFTSKPSFWADRIHPEDASRIFADLPQISTKGYHEHQYRWQVADGSYRWFYNYTRFMKSSDGENYILGMMQDITERKRADETLKKEKDKAQTYLDVAGVILVAINAEQKVTLINRRGCEILGYAQEEVIGKNWFDHFIPERLRKEVRTIFSSLVTGETEPLKDVENKVLTKSGEEKTIAWHNTIIADESGHIVGTLSSGEDITETKRAQEALFTAAQQWRTTFDGISDIVCLLDPEGKILKCNRALTKFSGKSFSDILHRPYWEIIHGTAAPVKESPVELMKETRRKEIAVLPVGGRWFNVAVDPLLDDKGALVGTVHIMSDITERRRAVERVESLSKENAIMAEIGRIISSTLNIDEVYERFSQEVRKLIPFDRIEIITTNRQDYTITIAYITGIEVRGRNAGDTIPMLGTAVQEVSRTRTSQLIQPLNIEELERRFPPLLSSFEAGLRSMIFVPLISEDQVIGALSLKTTKPDFYTERDLRLTERVGNQIAGAVANARLFIERKQAEEEARRNEEDLQALMDASPMAISWGDIHGNIRYINCKFRELFGYTVEDIPTIAEWRRLAYPDSAYRETIPSLLVMLTEAQKQGREPTPTEAIIACKDGSRRHVEQTGAFASNRILAIYKDITERKRAEEALKKSEEEAKRLSQENAVVAEIGRIVSSTLNIEEVYERFAQELRKLILVDRVSVSTINPDGHSATIAYAWGHLVENRNQGNVFSLEGTLNEQVIAKRRGIFVYGEGGEALAEVYPALLNTLRSGLRSIMAVPLFSKDQVIGCLNLHAFKDRGFTEQDLELAERVANQIAGAVANAQLYAEHKQAEEKLASLSQENAVMAEIGRLVSSSSNIDEVYERFAQEVRKLISFDRLGIQTINTKAKMTTLDYIIGVDIEGRRSGDMIPLEGTAIGECVRTRSSVLLQTENINELAKRLPGFLPTFKAGLRSMISVPLFSKDEVIGVFHLRSFKTNAYTESDLRLAERVGNQIAGAIANAQLFAERKRAEEVAAKSANENATMAEIGRIVGSTLNVKEVYERFTQEVRKLIPFDRIGIQTVNTKSNTTTLDYISGVDVESRRAGDVIPLEGTAVGECVGTRSSFVFQAESEEEVLKRFPNFLPTFKAGLQSMICVPLISKNQVIGILHVLSLKSNAYTDSDLKLAERVGNQIAGAIANAQLFVERKRMESALRKSETKFRDLYDNAPLGYQEYDNEGRVTNVNDKELAMLGYSAEEMIGRPIWEFNVDPDIVREQVLAKLSGIAPPGQNLERVYRKKDGSPIPVLIEERFVFDEHGQKKGIRCTVQDITQRKEIDKALQRSEEEAKRLSQENAIMAEIGRVISSTLNIETVYERFAEEVRKLIPFDRIALTTINAKDHSGSVAYAWGVDVSHRRQGEVFSIANLFYERLMTTRAGVLAQAEDEIELTERYPDLQGVIHAGFRSMISVPLVSKDQVIGVLHIRSFKPNIYTESDLRLAERVGNQIAGAIANAQLYAEHKHAEEKVSRLSQENAIVAEIGRIISSSLNIDEVYERFAQELRKLIFIDRVSLSAINPDGRSATIAYSWGVNIENRKRGDVFSLKGTLVEKASTRRSGILVEAEDEETFIQTYPTLLKSYRAGFRSFISVPLISEDQVIGVLILHTLKEKVYTEQDIQLAERIGNQIAGAIANAQLFAERKRAEEEAARWAQENAVVAEIGRIVSSSSAIDEVYERFAEEVRKLIAFDRIMINIVNLENSTTSFGYITGIDVQGRRVGDIVPLDGTATGECVRTRSSFIFQTENMDEVVKTFSGLLPTFQAGLRSMIFVPLMSKDQVIAVLSLRTIKPSAYTEGDLRLAERVGNQIAGAIANAQLFAERKRAEEALRKSEAKFQELFDEAPVGYQEIDCEGRIVRINRTELDMLGYTAEEMFGKGLREFVTDEESRQIVEGKLAGTIPTGIAFERVFQRKDGTTFSAVMQDRVLRDSKGKITGILATVQDVTERKRSEEEKALLQEQLRQSQKMEAIGKLAGGVAHDFNNLLTVIHGYGELLLNSLGQDSRLQQDVLEITHAAERASSLTRQLLAFSRKQVLQPKVLDLNAHVSNMDKMLRRMIGEDIELVTLLAKDLGRIKADPGQIEQVTLNIAVNAKDAMPNGGKLTIETANVKLDETYARSRIGVIPGDYVMLSMSDTGLGIPPEIKERIFEPFFTTKEKGKGTGLGLSTVYGIIQQSGGNIWVYSEPGLGTTFKIYLPRIDERAESLRPAAVSNKSLQGSETILVVEDEKIVRKLACTILRKNGYSVLEASNGEEALDVVQEQNGNPIHLLVTDVVMPGMSGRQLVDRLAVLRPEIKILYMSGYTDNAIVHHGVLDPGIAYIQKPFTPDAFASKVREILDEGDRMKLDEGKGSSLPQGV